MRDNPFLDQTTTCNLYWYFLFNKGAQQSFKIGIFVKKNTNVNYHSFLDEIKPVISIGIFLHLRNTTEL